MAVLLVSLASAIAMGGGERGYFYRWRFLHDQMTAKNLTIAENMSPKHGLRLAVGVWRDGESGGYYYDLYGRFPVGGYALIKLAALPFGSDLSAKLVAARALMMLMFCGAALLAYLALARIAGNRWIALAAVLLAFSGFYPLYYADSAAGETVMDLFGIALVFHGMVLFVQEGRFRQLLLKVCAALLMGWHPYALILPFALLGFGGEALALVRAKAGSVGGGRGGIRAALAALPTLARSRFVALAAVSVLFGSALLALNFANEYAAYGGKRSWRDLPLAGSMMKALGLNPSYGGHPNSAPGAFLTRQLHRVGVASAPYVVAGAGVVSGPYASAGRAALSEPYALEGFSGIPIQDELETPSPAWAAWGGAAALAAAAAAFAVPRRFRLPMACLVLTGFVWALAARGNVSNQNHAYEGLIYVWLPLALWCGALIGARRLLGGRLGGASAIAAAAIAAPLFALSAFYAAQVRWDEFAAQHSKEILADIHAIREVASEKGVVLSAPAWHAAARFYGLAEFQVGYYLSESYIWRGGEPVLRGDEATWPDAWRFTVRGARQDPRGADAEYAVLRYRNEGAGLLTPDNRHLFLYERGDLAGLYRAERRRLAASEPDARSEFDVYLEEGALRYLKSPCAPGDADDFFFAHFFPADPDYLRGESVPTGFEGVNFPFAAVNNTFDSSGVYFDDACMTTVNVPYYPIAAIRTGQYVMSEDERLWEVSIFPPPSAETLADYESAYRAVADGGEPAARSGFDMHINRLNGNKTISYLKDPCSEEDARGRFFLSVHPVNIADLPADRRELGHDGLNFSFEPPQAVVFNGKCMATRQLPDYEIAKIETGQWVPGGERLWDAAVEIGD